MPIKVPEIVVPPFWLSNLGGVYRYLRQQVRKGQLHDIGRSCFGHPLYSVEYPRPGCSKLMVIGGTHGHEPGGVAAAMNLIHLLEAGTDLAGRPHDELLRVAEQVHLFVVPCLNPDGRSVCPDSFYAQGLETLMIYACGLQQDGSLIPYDSESDTPLYYFDPGEAIFVGGQFNGAGYAINRRRSADYSDAQEVQALLEFVRDGPGRGLEAIMDLHACGYNFGIQARSHEPPYWPVLREWQRRALAAFTAKGRPLRPRLYGDGDPPQPPPFHYNSTLFHRHARLLWFAYEGRQGHLGRPSFMPLPTEWEIVDDYLTAMTYFFQLGVEERYAQVNREVFG